MQKKKGEVETSLRVLMLPKSMQNAKNRPFCNPSHPLLYLKGATKTMELFCVFSNIGWHERRKRALRVNFTIFDKIVNFVKHFETLNTLRDQKMISVYFFFLTHRDNYTYL